MSSNADAESQDSLFIENKIVSFSERNKSNRQAKKLDASLHEANPTDWLTSEEAAQYLRLISKDGAPCAQSLRNLVSQRRIPFYKPFGRLLFRRSELLKFIESSRKGGFKCR